MNCLKAKEKETNVQLKKQIYFEIYNEYIKPFIFELLICFIFIMIFTASNLMYPYFLKLIIDDTLVSKNIHELFRYTLIMLFIVIIMLISRYFVANKSLVVCQKITLKIRQTIIEQLTKYSMSFFREYENGQIISIIENDLQNVQRVALYMISEFLVALITTIGLLVIIFTINPYIGMACIGLLVIYIYLQKNNGEKIKNNS